MTKSPNERFRANGRFNIVRNALMDAHGTEVAARYARGDTPIRTERLPSIARWMHTYRNTDAMLRFGTNGGLKPFTVELIQHCKTMGDLIAVLDKLDTPPVSERLLTQEQAQVLLDGVRLVSRLNADRYEVTVRDAQKRAIKFRWCLFFDNTRHPEVRIELDPIGVHLDEDSKNEAFVDLSAFMLAYYLE